MHARRAWLSLIVGLIAAGCDYREGLSCIVSSECAGLVCIQGQCTTGGVGAGGGGGGGGVVGGGGGSAASGALFRIDSTSKLVYADAQHVYWHKDDQLNRLLKRTPIMRDAVSTTLGDVGETNWSLVITTGSGEALVHAGGRVTRWSSNGALAAQWMAQGGIALHGDQVFWIQRNSSSGMKSLVRSDRSGVIAATLEELQVYQVLFARLLTTNAGFCFTEDTGNPAFRAWDGGRVTLGGERFELTHSNGRHCVWKTAFTAGSTSVTIFDVLNQSSATRLTASFDVHDAVIAGDKIVLLEGGLGRLWVGGLSGGQFAAPREPRNTSTLRFSSLVASDTRVFALAGVDVYEVIP